MAISEQQYGARRALLVAVDKYDHAHRLASPVRDILKLKQVLTAKEIGPYRVKVLWNEPAHILREEIEEFFREGQADELLLLFFSGHGFTDDHGILHLFGKNSREDRLDSTAVSADFIQAQVENSICKSKVVILDCCFAGAALGTLNDAFVLAATRAHEPAFEPRPSQEEHQSSEVTSSSYFTSALLEGLVTGDADTDGDGQIEVRELSKYISRSMKRAGREQNSVFSPGRFGDDIMLYIASSIKGASSGHEAHPGGSAPSPLTGAPKLKREPRWRSALLYAIAMYQRQTRRLVQAFILLAIPALIAAGVAVFAADAAPIPETVSAQHCSHDTCILVFGSGNTLIGVGIFYQGAQTFVGNFHIFGPRDTVDRYLPGPDPETQIGPGVGSAAAEIRVNVPNHSLICGEVWEAGAKLKGNTCIGFPLR